MSVFEETDLMFDWSNSRFFNPKTDNKLSCPCCGLLAHTQGIISLINSIRTEFNKPIIVNSGTRCPNHNSEVGGKPKSYHIAIPDMGILSKALDISVYKLSDLDKLEEICKLYLMDKGGLIRYQNFIHIDTRKNKYRA